MKENVENVCKVMSYVMNAYGKVMNVIDCKGYEAINGYVRL